MAPGNAFEKWFDGVLGGRTFDGMTTTGNWSDSRLRLIAADVTNGRLLVLPEDLPGYSLPRPRTRRSTRRPSRSRRRRG